MHEPHDATTPRRQSPSRVPRGRRWRAFALAIALGQALSVVAAAVPQRAEAVGPLPECRIADILTVPRGYDDWSITLVDWLLRVEDDYVPPDLVPVTDAGVPGGGFVRAVAIDDLRAMGEAAAAAGNPIGVWSPYRSYDEQVTIYNNYVAMDGVEGASTYSMPPGHSEHQLGLGVDFMSAGGGNPLIGDWRTTPAGKWMSENAWQYGWVMSYPLDPDWQIGDDLWSDRVCFTYEPWHYRYLGREVAAAVHESGLTIREYLWQHYTQVDPVTGQAIPTPTPTPTPTPMPTPTPVPTPTPSETPPPTTTPTATPAPEASGDAIGDPLVLGAIGLGVVLIGISAVLALRRSRFG